MTIIRFPDRRDTRSPEVSNQQTQAAGEVYFPMNRDENEAVRHFALTMAEKLLRDKELNHAAPLLVDKVIRMLINESRDGWDRR